MLTKDKLWKAIFEDFFPDAILFFFPDYHGDIDWSRGYTMLDKELLQLFPESEGNERRADLLVKVWLKNGIEQWILIHVEVQGYKDLAFPQRMFIYYYRVLDRYQVPISALALLTDGNRNWRPDCYIAQCMDTELTYQYPVFKLIDYEKTTFDNNPNPWAVVMKAALIGMKSKWTDEALMVAKLQLYKELRVAGYKQEQVRNLLQFIKYHVRFQEKENFYKFDNQIQFIDNQNQAMGIVELVKQHLIEEAKNEGIERGLEKGLERGMDKGIAKGVKRGEEKKSIIGVRNMLVKGFDKEVIMDILSLKKEVVEQISAQLQKEKEVFSLIKKGLSDKAIAKKLAVSDVFVEVLRETLK